MIVIQCSLERLKPRSFNIFSKRGGAGSGHAGDRDSAAAGVAHRIQRALLVLHQHAPQHRELADAPARDVTERAHSYVLSKKVQKTCQFWLLS